MYERVVREPSCLGGMTETPGKSVRGRASVSSELPGNGIVELIDLGRAMLAVANSKSFQIAH